MGLKQNLDILVYNNIVDSLIVGEYQMGQQILLDTFAEKYGVSRTPIIQAVKLLANDGILDVLPNGRVCVPTYSEEQIKKIRNVRIILEHYALEELFKEQNADSFNGTIEELDKIALQALEAIENGNKLLFNQKDLEFHRCLVNGAKNEFLSDIYKRIQGRFVVANYLFIPWENRDFMYAAKDHLAIMKALKAKDLENCKKYVQQHIRNVVKGSNPA
ncbi:MAG: GntR family transcriptional regulator [Lachnospiraceae bacterium]|nr:GntR family transcriptional regulator [Lachnospiraceae bacterium]